MQLLIEDTQTDLSLSVSSAEKLLSTLLKILRIKTDELSLHFVSEKEIAKVHADFFNDPTPTDCISFPIDPPKAKATPHVLGEIFVCPAVAIAYGKEHGIDPYEELSRYVLHGVLHLIGHDDLTEKDYLNMKHLEEKYLKALKEKGTLLGTSPLLQENS